MKRQAKDLTEGERLEILQAFRYWPFDDIRDIIIAEQAHRLGVHEDTVRLVAMEK